MKPFINNNIFIGEDFILRDYLAGDMNKGISQLISKKYFDKYRNQTFFSRIGKLLGIYQSFLLVSEDCMTGLINGAVVIRKKLNLLKFHQNYWIYGVIVKTEMRGKGLGFKLILAAKEALINRNISEIYLYVNENNQVAINLYKKTGFSIIGKKLSSNNLLLIAHLKDCFNGKQ